MYRLKLAYLQTDELPVSKHFDRMAIAINTFFFLVGHLKFSFFKWLGYFLTIGAFNSEVSPSRKGIVYPPESITALGNIFLSSLQSLPVMEV